MIASSCVQRLLVIVGLSTVSCEQGAPPPPVATPAPKPTQRAQVAAPQPQPRACRSLADPTVVQALAKDAADRDAALRTAIVAAGGSPIELPVVASRDPGITGLGQALPNRRMVVGWKNSGGTPPATVVVARVGDEIKYVKAEVTERRAGTLSICESGPECQGAEEPPLFLIAALPAKTRAGGSMSVAFEVAVVEMSWEVCVDP